MRLPLLTLWRSLGRAAPAYSPQKALQGQCGCAKAHKSHAVSPVPPVPGNPSRSPAKNGQTQSEPTKADNRTNTARTREWRSRPGGTGTQAIASRPVCRNAANSRREPRQSAAAEPQRRARSDSKRNRQTRPSPAPQFRISPAIPQFRIPHFAFPLAVPPRAPPPQPPRQRAPAFQHNPRIPTPIRSISHAHRISALYMNK